MSSENWYTSFRFSLNVNPLQAESPHRCSQELPHPNTCIFAIMSTAIAEIYAFWSLTHPLV